MTLNEDNRDWGFAPSRVECIDLHGESRRAPRPSGNFDEMTIRVSHLKWCDAIPPPVGGLVLRELYVDRVDVDHVLNLMHLLEANRATLEVISINSPFTAEMFKSILHRPLIWPQLRRIDNPGAYPTDYSRLNHKYFPRLVYFRHSMHLASGPLVRDGSILIRPYNEKMFHMVQSNRARLKRVVTLYLCLFPRIIPQRDVVRLICNCILDTFVDFCGPDELRLDPLRDSACPVLYQMIEQRELKRKRICSEMTRLENQIEMDKMRLKQDLFEAENILFRMDRHKRRILESQSALQSLQNMEW